MNLFRVGSCLALLVGGIGCTQASQSITAPSATIGGSTANAADGSTLKVTAPALVSPVDGVRAEDRRPTLIWLNSTGKYDPIGVAYDLEVSSPSAVVYSRTVGESPNLGAHLIDLELDYDIVYSWRARARVADSFGPWSSWASFMSPTRPVASVTAPSGSVSTGGCAAPISPLGAGESRRPRPNDSATVRAVQNAFPASLQHSCQPEGGSWEFMDRVVDALRAKDGRYGYNAKRGNTNDPSLDVVSYFWANGDNIQGRAEVYIFDVIAGHCGATPSTIWTDVTDVTFNSGTLGRTIYPRPGRAVAPCASAAQ
jgi:hypothetical protein